MSTTADEPRDPATDPDRDLSTHPQDPDATQPQTPNPTHEPQPAAPDTQPYDPDQDTTPDEV